MYTVALFSHGGSVLWQSSPKDNSIPITAFNEAISADIQGKSYTSPTYTVKLVANHELKVSCAVGFPSVVSLQNTQQLAIDLLKIYASTCGEGLEDGEEPDLTRFGELADLRLKEYALASINASKAAEGSTNSSGSSKPANIPAEDAREITPRAQTPSRKPAAAAAAASSSKKSKKKKSARKWDGSTSDDENVVLDYSSAQDAAQDLGVEQLDSSDLGQQTASGFQVKNLEDELDAILSADTPVESTKKPMFGFLKNYVGGKKLSDADLSSALAKMENSLVSKNVTKDIAHEMCEQVRNDLVGATTSSWTTVNATVHESMSRILSKILTPNSSNDLLREIQKAKAQNKIYVMSIVGVNGVGKSTNLSKIAFWLLQNKFKVLIAACDTFRSGAVEQLGVHVKRLQQLTERQDAGTVELFDQGYGKDAAMIAKKAVEYGEKHGFDVVLIDTAGRRHNDQRLMSSLEKFGKLANPDKIIMVGEALVGTDSVEQARNFNSAFGAARNIDFFLVSKCDTVGEMLGTLVNMTNSTGIPVLFVGVGQNYTDLRTLSVDWAVRMLMS